MNRPWNIVQPLRTRQMGKAVFVSWCCKFACHLSYDILFTFFEKLFTFASMSSTLADWSGGHGQVPPNWRGEVSSLVAMFYDMVPLLMSVNGMHYGMIKWLHNFVRWGVITHSCLNLSVGLLKFEPRWLTTHHHHMAVINQSFHKCSLFWIGNDLYH